MLKLKQLWAVAAAGVLLAAPGAQAALVSLGDGTVKDTNTNLIWLQNWNVTGLQDWNTQKAWAETTLDGFAGSSDWRLPEISEYAALFTAYGNLGAVANFTNVQFYGYSSGTDIAGGSWVFNPVVGVQFGANHVTPLYAVAVRPGDVTSSVPEPQSLALALLALGATAVARRKRSR